MEASIPRVFAPEPLMGAVASMSVPSPNKSTFETNVLASTKLVMSL
jgi:hypothetical protein